MDNQRVIFQNDAGGVSIIVPAPGATLEEVLTAVPAGKAYEVVNVDDIPDDRTFRDAWHHDTSPEPQKIAVDVTKAKDIAHELRRAARTQEFAPLDVKVTIPGEAAGAESQRQAVRDKYAAIQTEINGCTSCDQLKGIIEREGL